MAIMTRQRTSSCKAQTCGSLKFLLIWPITTRVNSYFHHVLQFINQHKEHHIWPINGERSRGCVREPDERKKKRKIEKKQSQKSLKRENKIIMELHTGEFLTSRTTNNSKPRKSIIHNFRLTQNLRSDNFTQSYHTQLESNYTALPGCRLLRVVLFAAFNDIRHDIQRANKSVQLYYM